MKQTQATLVDGKSYSLNGQIFTEGTPVVVNEATAERLKTLQRTFTEPRTEKQHVVKKFQIEEVDVEEKAPDTGKLPDATPPVARTRTNLPPTPES